MSTLQRIRLVWRTAAKPDGFLVEFSTAARDYRVVLAEALALIDPWWSRLTYMERNLYVLEDGQWEPYL